MRKSPSSFPESQVVTELLGPEDPRFPAGFRDLQETAPQQLWVRGSVDILSSPVIVAVVGTRRASGYGLRVARELSGSLARAGACIVSGMALGIDAAAHRAALDCGGSTLAVLGTGLDVVYPRSHRQLQRDIAARGALITEMEPLDHGMRWTFPLRNRLIAALASITIVVEAPLKSGALNTAEHALTLGRTLAAVPGPIDQPASAGSNQLIRDGAHVLASVADALALAGLTAPPVTPRGAPDGDEGRVWAALSNGPLDMDSLCSQSGLPASRCMAAVTTLELAGSVECGLTGEIRRR